MDAIVSEKRFIDIVTPSLSKVSIAVFRAAELRMGLGLIQELRP